MHLFLILFILNLLSGSHKWSNWSCIDESSSNNLGWVDDTSFNHVNILVFASIETKFFIFLGKEFSNNNCTFSTSVLNNSSNWKFNSLLDDLNTNILIEVISLNVFKSTSSIKKCTTTTYINIILIFLPTTIPSSTAALVAFKASVILSLISPTSTSEAPPTLMTPTPPWSLARRSASFSLSYSDVVTLTYSLS